MGKGSLSFSHLSSTHQRKKGAAAQTSTLSSPPLSNMRGTEKGKKKSGGGSSRLWMRFDRSGAMEVKECDKSTIIKRASLPANDLSILGPLFSHSTNIIGREKAIVVNLEVIKAIITVEEVMLLHPLCSEVLILIDRLKQQFPQAHAPSIVESCLDHQEDLKSELPFEFQVLDIALEVVCSLLDTSFDSLEREAWSILDELTKNTSKENLEHVRSLKTKLTHLLARVQKVRNEIEHLLDDDEDMADLYVTRKQQTPNLLPSTNMARSNTNVEDLEMLLEGYLMQLEGMRNKILMVRQYIDDTEDYVKIQNNNRRNGFIQSKQIVNVISLAVTAGNVVVSLFGMNIPIPLYNTGGVFGYVVLSDVALIIVICMVTFGYARWKKLFD